MAGCQWSESESRSRRLGVHRPAGGQPPQLGNRGRPGRGARRRCGRLPVVTYGHGKFQPDPSPPMAAQLARQRAHRRVTDGPGRTVTPAAGPRPAADMPCPSPRQPFRAESASLAYCGNAARRGPTRPGSPAVGFKFQFKGPGPGPAARSISLRLRRRATGRPGGPAARHSGRAAAAAAAFLGPWQVTVSDGRLIKLSHRLYARL